MRVIFLGAYDNSEIVLAPIKVGKNLFNNLRRKKIEVVYLCYYDDGTKYSRIQKLFGFEKVAEGVFRCGIFPLFFFVIRYKPGIIQIVTPDAFYLPLFLLKIILKYKIAYLSHNIISYSLKNFLQISCYQKIRFRIIEKFVLKYSDKLEILSRVEARFLARFVKVDTDKIIIVDNGLNPSTIKKEYTENSDNIKIIFIGSITRKEKSFEFLLQALSEINCPVVLNVYSYEQQRKGSIEIPKNVQLNLGKPLTEIELRKEFCRNDLFIIPSIRDTFPLSLLEAMDIGILFIVSDKVGFVERFPDSLKEFVVPFGNAKILAIKILRLHKLDTGEKNRFAESIRSFVSNFNWDKVSDSYIQAYNELLSPIHK